MAKKNTLDVEKYAPTSWAKNKEFKEPFDYTTSSGQLILVQRLDMDDLLTLGLEDDLDFMSKAIVSEDTDEKKVEAENESSISKALKSGNLPKLTRIVNAVCLRGILAPKLHDIPVDVNARQKGLFYIDSVPFQERVELFSVIFDTEGLQTFREETPDDLGRVADESTVSLPAESDMGV